MSAKEMREAVTHTIAAVADSDDGGGSGGSSGGDDDDDAADNIDDSDDLAHLHRAIDKDLFWQRSALLKQVTDIKRHNAIYLTIFC